MKYPVYLAECTKGGGIYHALPEGGKWEKTANVDNAKNVSCVCGKIF